MKARIAKCFEVREVWDGGCTSEDCPLRFLPATTRPCIERRSAYSMGLSEGDGPIDSPVGRDKQELKNSREMRDR